MGSGSSKVDWRHSGQQQHQRHPSHRTASSSKGKHKSLDETPYYPPTRSASSRRQTSSRSKAGVREVSESYVPRAFTSEDGQYYFNHDATHRHHIVQPLTNPLPEPPKDLYAIYDATPSEYHQARRHNPPPFVPISSSELKKTKSFKGKPFAERLVPVHEPSSSDSSDSSASTSHPPPQVVIPHTYQGLVDPHDLSDHRKKKKRSWFSSWSSRSKKSRSRSIDQDQVGFIPPGALSGPPPVPPKSHPVFRHASSGSIGISGPRPISPPYMLAPRQHMPPPQPIYFYLPDQAFFGFTTFSPHKIYYKKHLYPTAEHLYQCMKFMPSKEHGGDANVVELIRESSENPLDAVYTGRQYNKQARSDWKEKRTKWMDEILYLKFSQHQDIRNELMSTNPAELVFGSQADSFWGLGKQLNGQNELGKALERVRIQLIKDMTL